jgi:hypothetical protein
VIVRSLADHLENWLGLAGGRGEGAWLETAAYYGALTSPDHLPEAFAEVKKLLMPPGRPKQDRRRLEKHLEKLTADLAKARGNLVLLDPENIPDAQERIRKMDEERAAVEQELKECRPPAEEEVNAVVLSVLNALYSLAQCCRVLTKPVYVNAAGQRAIDNGDGTLTYSWHSQFAPQAVKTLLTRLTSAGGSLVCHTTIRVGKKVNKRTTWVDRDGVRRYAEKEVVCGTRHLFGGGEIRFRNVVNGKIL